MALKIHFTVAALLILNISSVISDEGKLCATKEFIEELLPENCTHVNKSGTPRKPEDLRPASHAPLGLLLSDQQFFYFVGKYAKVDDLSSEHSCNSRNDNSDVCPTTRNNSFGQSCQKSCTQDKDCPRKRQKCLCDGECGMSCISARSICPWPVTIINTDTSLNQETRNFGDKMTVRCHPGFKMANGQEMTQSRCQGDKKWSVTAPCDEVNLCGDPYVIENGYFVKNRDSVKGLTIQYYCNPGFRLHGDDVIECLENNTWSNLAPVCQHVSTQTDPVTILPTPSPGTPSSMVPSHSCDDIYCPPPPQIKEGVLIAVTKAEYDISEVIYYMCNKNFYMDGSHSAKCLPNGEWSKIPYCRARCKIPVQKSQFIYKGKKTWVTEVEEGLVPHSEIVTFFCRNATEACSYEASTQCFDGVLPLPDCYVEPTWVEYTFFTSKLVSEIASCQGL